jgi:hypothetical protein
MEGAEHVGKALAGLQGDLALVVTTLGVFTHVWDVVSKKFPVFTLLKIFLLGKD